MEPIKLAIVGVGKIAVDQHIPTLKKDNQYSLVALVSPHIHEQHALLAALPHVAVFASLEALLESDVDVDAVTLAAPPQSRYELAEMALKHGLDVMLEKPPGRTLQEVNVLRDLAEKHQCVLFSSYHSRGADQVAAAREWLEEKNITGLNIQWKEDVRQWHFGQDWVFQPGGLGVFDPGINAFSIATILLPKGFHFSRGMIDIPGNRQTPVAAHLEGVLSGYGDGNVVVDLDWLYQGDPMWNIEIKTDEGVLLLTHGGDNLSLNGEVQPTQDDRQGHADLQGEYPYLYKHFARLVKNRTIEIDLAPLNLVSDALLVSEARQVDAFEWETV